MKIHQIGRTLFTRALLTGWLLLTGVPAAAELIATVDRTIVSDLDLVTLTVRASNDSSDAEPDFSGLNRDFDVVSTSSRQSSSMSIINGRTTSTVYVDHTLQLAPKRLGTLTIPAITAGRERTEPITIRVQKQSVSQQQRMQQFVFFETKVDTNDTYVQGQIIYSVKLFYTEAIGGDFPQPPALDDAIVETIETEKRYESIISGKRYFVLEKRYAIFPQRSGELVIPRERFRGTRGRGGVFSQRQVVNAVSDAHTINVKRIPNTFSGQTWIPAKALAATESWAEEPPVFRVGEPINRLITVSAMGVSETLLPQVGDMTIENAKVYADPPVSQSRVGPEGLSSQSVTTIGIVPTVEGDITLPEIRIPWWNTQSDREEIAVIQAATYQVLPATGEINTAPQVTVPITELQRPQVVTETAPPYWQWLALAFGALWLISTWQWLMLRRKVRVLESASASRYEKVVFSEPDEEREYKALKDACNRGDASGAHRQLFLWAKARFPDIDSINQLSAHFTELADEIRLLEAHLYGMDSAGDWRGKMLLQGIDDIRRRKVSRATNKALTPNLNPA
jgi:hypothetical protein